MSRMYAYDTHQCVQMKYINLVLELMKECVDFISYSTALPASEPQLDQWERPFGFKKEVILPLSCNVLFL